MTTVFIGGSRKLSKLNKKITQVLDRVIDKGFTVLLGDANGADKAVQNYLVNKNYENVIVYCMKNTCRNNLGNWQTKNIEASRNIKDFQYYATKDLQMALDTNYGFMLWDSKSKGTLNNIMNLLNEHKYVVVYFAPLKIVRTLKNFDELQELLKECDSSVLTQHNKVIKTRHTYTQPALFVSESKPEYRQ
jgi:hypothetical protein